MTPPTTTSRKAVLPDIKPRTPVAHLDRRAWSRRTETFAVADVAPVVGMSRTFIQRATGHGGRLSVDDVILLLDQDAYSETFVPRSRILDYLTGQQREAETGEVIGTPQTYRLIAGSVTDTIQRLDPGTVDCVVTSTPYWGMRVYNDTTEVAWADGETSAYGHEQTPEAFVRHTVQILHMLRPALTETASVWWNVMDSYNTRTQIRGSAVEALRAMQGKDGRRWSEHDARRHSAGHSYLKDGEQCGIPGKIAERASRIGYHVKSTITWVKTATLPEPQNSRVSRGLEYVLHLAPSRTPKFNKEKYRTLPAAKGGRSVGYEPDKLTDVWVLPTSAGGGHGAQFPLALPGRCIAVSTDPGDLVLDPFVGSGTSGFAARTLGCRFIGIDVSPSYITQAEERIAMVQRSGFDPEPKPETPPFGLPMTDVS